MWPPLLTYSTSAELKDVIQQTQVLADEGKVKEQKYNALKGKVGYNGQLSNLTFYRMANISEPMTNDLKLGVLS